MIRTSLTVGLFLASLTSVTDDSWESIFNGKDLSGWTVKIKGSKVGEDPYQTFSVQGGAITVTYDNYTLFKNRFGHLFFMENLSHYKLKLDYRFTGDQVKDGEGWAYRNSGVMLHGQHPESMAVDQDFPVSVEVQLLGGNGKDNRSTANICTPGTHVEIEGKLEKNHCINSTSKTYHGDQWVHLELEVKGGKVIRHSINGDKVFDYGGAVLDSTDPDAKRLIENGFPLSLSTGYFSLQSESHPVQFKNIFLKRLDK
ncbi:DUF1080 domain-containing protein [Temperatibacter marinus]|uniref:DUF1080 domain-containing protein n=1 Tax=Temperatibacter marinus TaxID=1456591 RepID=A0AA52H9N3_9PROT|nr:DUF1080 domain-containing protein [Temperatibacter marinus]WND02707.1 DUF1080 domain-containing protein [Temperatibacter marinus]